MTEAESINTAVVRRYFEEVYNQSNEEVLAELVTSDYLDYGHPEPGEGLEGAKQDLRGLLKGFDQVHYVINDIIAAGDSVGAYWTGTMRYKGDTPDSPAAGKIVSYNGVSIYKFRDGKIFETRNVQDFAGILSQIRG